MSNVVQFPPREERPPATTMLKDLLADAIEHERLGNDFQVCVITIVTKASGARVYKTAFTRMPAEHVVMAAELLGKDILDQA